MNALLAFQQGSLTSSVWFCGTVFSKPSWLTVIKHYWGKKICGFIARIVLREHMQQEAQTPAAFPVLWGRRWRLRVNEFPGGACVGFWTSRSHVTVNTACPMWEADKLKQNTCKWSCGDTFEAGKESVILSDWGSFLEPPRTCQSHTVTHSVDVFYQSTWQIWNKLVF